MLPMPSIEDARDVPLTTGDVAKAFNVSPVTVINWADTGKLPSFRTPGGHRRFRQADIDAFIAEQREAASA